MLFANNILFGEELLNYCWICTQHYSNLFAILQPTGQIVSFLRCFWIRRRKDTPYLGQYESWPEVPYVPTSDERTFHVWSQHDVPTIFFTSAIKTCSENLHKGSNKNVLFDVMFESDVKRMLDDVLLNGNNLHAFLANHKTLLTWVIACTQSHH